MKTTSLFVLSLLLVVSLPFFAAINYSITFTGSGASTTVGDVVVQNLTKGTTVTVPVGNVLNLSDEPNAVDQFNANDETIRVYPSFVEGKSMVSFFAKQAGMTQINVFGIDGRKTTGITTNLQEGKNLFQLSLPKGSFAIQVSSKGYAYSAKMINQIGTLSRPEITYIGTEKPFSAAPQKSKSSAIGTTTMTYTIGDHLLYKGTSSNFNTVLTDIPTASKTINFVFVACTDGAGNNYKVVKIGTQTWMAENLKTTRYNDGTSIPYVTQSWYYLSTPAYCWYNNDANTYKNTYGALYNWYTVNTSKLAPIGWHVPTDDEWTILEYYLMDNGYNYDGTTKDNMTAKSLAATTDWITYTGTGVIGNDLSKNNSTGFSALPCGYRDDNDPFYDRGLSGYWWSSTGSMSYTSGAVGRSISASNSIVNRLDYSYYIYKASGFSVRCVKN